MVDASIVQCNSCHGIYRPVQRDGTQYFHACPTQRVTADAVIDQASGKVITPATFALIANRRDENVLSVDAQGTVTIKSVGTGTTPVLDPAVIAAAGF